MMSQAQVPQVDGSFFLRLGGAWRCVAAGMVELPAASEAAFLFLLSSHCGLLHRSRVGSINFPSIFGASWNDSFVLSPPFVALLAR